jgi:hypothetical protein
MVNSELDSRWQRKQSFQDKCVPKSLETRKNQKLSHTLTMTFTQSILLELFKAVVAGSFAAAVFVFGQAVQRFLFEPVAEMRKLVGQIATDLVFYRNRFSAPDAIPLEQWIEATDAYRKHAAALRSLPLAIPFYDSIAKFFSLPCRQQTREASHNLIGISNMTYKNPSHDDFTYKNQQFDAVHQLLNIPKDCINGV